MYAAKPRTDRGRPVPTRTRGPQRTIFVRWGEGTFLRPSVEGEPLGLVSTEALGQAERILDTFSGRGPRALAY